MTVVILKSWYVSEAKTEKILLIHPDSAMRDELIFLLQHSGFEVVSASEAAEGFAEVCKSAPDLVLMAEGSRKLNGDELCIRIQEVSDVPIIVLGEGENNTAGVKFLEMGADAYLTSPLNARELLAYVRARLRRYKESIKQEEI